MRQVRELRTGPAQDKCQYTVGIFILTTDTYYVPSSMPGALFKAIISGRGFEKWCLVYNRHPVST